MCAHGRLNPNFALFCLDKDLLLRVEYFAVAAKELCGAPQREDAWRIFMALG
jgi:hypothetical protein